MRLERAHLNLLVIAADAYSQILIKADAVCLQIAVDMRV